MNARSSATIRSNRVSCVKRRRFFAAGEIFVRLYVFMIIPRARSMGLSSKSASRLSYQRLEPDIFLQILFTMINRMKLIPLLNRPMAAE